MLINFSNHPSKDWPLEQKEAAKYYGEIIDLPFPSVPPDLDAAGIRAMAEEALVVILSHLRTNKEHFAVHVMGELTLCYSVILRLQTQGIICLASTTNRNVIANANTTKTTIFSFGQFREYESLIKPL